MFSNIKVLSADWDHREVTQFGADGFPEGFPDGYFGHVLIDDRLIPYTFFDRLEYQLASQEFLYGRIRNPKEMVGEKFWQSLDENERHVLGACVLILIKEGRVTLCYENTRISEGVCDGRLVAGIANNVKPDALTSKSQSKQNNSELTNDGSTRE